MNFILNRSMSRKDSLKSTSIMSCDSSSSSSSSSSGCCSNLSSSTAQVSGGEEVCVSSSNIDNSGKRKKSISSPCHLKGGVGSSVSCISSHSSCFPDHRFSGSDFNSDLHSNLCQLSSRSPSTVPSSTNGSISSSFGVQSDIEFGPMGTIKRKSSSSSSASTHLNGPVLPLTSITRSLAKHSSDDCLLVEINEDRVIGVNSGTSGDNFNCNGNILLQSNVQYGTLKMRRSFRSREVSSSFRDSNYSYSNGGFNHRPFISRRSSQGTNASSECSSILSQPVHEQEEEEMIRRMRRDSSNYDPEEDDGSHDDLPLPPPPECGTGLTTSLSTLSLISLPPPPPEFSCATLDTNTLSSVSSSSPSSSSPSSSPSTATHSLDRSCCNSGSNVSTRDNTLTRTNVRLHQEQQSNQRQERVVGSGHRCCHRSSLSPSSASSSSFEEDTSCDGQGCSKCPPVVKQQNRQMAKSGAVGNRYQCYDERVNGHQVPCCSKSVVSNGKAVGGKIVGGKAVGGKAVGSKAVPMRSASCCIREFGAKQKILRSGSRVDSSSSFASSSASRHCQEGSSHVQHSNHLNHHPNESISAREGGRQFKATYSSTSSSSCSSRDGEDLSACSSMRECQSPESVGRIQRLDSFENVDDSYHNSTQHKTHAQARMKAKISGLNRSDQPIYDSVFTYRKQQPQLSQAIASDSTNVSSHESNHRLSEPQESTSRQVSRGSEDYGELPLPPPPPELSSNQQFQEVPSHQIQQVQNHGNNEISYINGSSSQPVYGVVKKGNKSGKEERRDPDSSFHHPVPVRSPVKGPLPPPPEEFVKNLHRVMEKKWKVAQALSGSEILTSFHPDSLAVGQDQFPSSEQVRVEFNHDSSLLPPPDPSRLMSTSQHEPLPPPPLHHHLAHGHAAHHNGMIDSHSSVPPPPALTCLQPYQYQQQQSPHLYQQSPHLYQQSPHLYQQSQPFSQSQQSFPPSSGNEDGGFYDVLPIAVRPFNGISIHQGGNPVTGNSGHSFQRQLDGGSQGGINHHRHYTENGSSSGSVFSRMIPFRRSSKVSSISSPNSSVSNNSSSSTGGGGGGGGGSGSKGAPPPPPKRSDKTKLSQRK